MTIGIKQRLGQQELIRVIGMGRLLHHNFIQVVGLQGGLHGLWFDLEHANTDISTLEIACITARGQGLDCFCRVAPTDYAVVTRCLEAGASGVMAAQISSPEQAEEFVQWCKFHPRGRRGLNVGGWDGGYGSVPVAEFCERSNRDNFVAIQVETAEAVDCCAELAAIDAVDMLFVGPSDLSQAVGAPGEFFHPRCVAAIERVGDACRTHGKQWGAVCVSPDHAKLLIDNGCKMLSPSADVKLVALGFQAMKATYSDLFSAAQPD